MAIEAGDGAGWAGAFFAGITILITLWQQRRQRKQQEAADDIARRQAEAQERRMLAAEENLQRLIAQLPAAIQAHAQAQIATPPERHAEAVSWELRRPNKNRFVLCNVGSETAAGVKVDLGGHPAGLTRRVPQDAVVRPKESVEFMMMAAWGAPLPGRVAVSWDGADEPAIVAVPHWG
ncbi:hypothetical protein GCM10018772_05080 [Streptomyces fumanus]|uniref:Uncharacterized protein n=2 Tax=Streptomyces fumanus TaxID=67302 RepID=A0A919DU94_9ACTN|nr:hypothetical protein GCM10018772_05080 [Streptomyces fumanus]